MPLVERSPESHVGNVRIETYVAAEKQILGHYSVVGQDMGGRESTFTMEILRRPMEESRIKTNARLGADTPWRYVPSIHGGGHRCAGCGEPFGRNDSSRGTHGGTEEDIPYRVTDGRKETTVLFCPRPNECAERFKDRVREGSIVIAAGVDATDETVDTDVAYRAAVESMGADVAQLLSTMPRCANPRCGKPYTPFTPGEKFCSIGCKGVAARVNKQEEAARTPQSRAQRDAQAASVKARFENRAREAAEAEAADAEDGGEE